MHLLLVEDDLELGHEILQSLVARDFTCVWVRSCNGAIKVIGDEGHAFQCAILDLGLTDGDGLDVLQVWRQSGIDMPVIVLTARGHLQSRVALLDAGADDYLVKPIEPEELAARVHAICRRVVGRTTSTWTVGNLKVDVNNRKISIEGVAVDLSKMEYLVLAELARQAGRVVPKHLLAKAVSPLGQPMEFNALEVHVHNLRKKLGRDAIVTVRGVGYRTNA